MIAEKIEAGRWVDFGVTRYYIVGKKTSGDWLAETKAGTAVTIRKDAACTLLPVECDSFDWKQETAESSDDWVVQDRVPARCGVDQYLYESSEEWRDVVKSGGWDGTEIHGWIDDYGDKLSLRCRRKDLPPAKRKVVLTEWLIERDGEIFLVVKSGEPWSTSGDKVTAVGTREFVVDC